VALARPRSKKPKESPPSKASVKRVEMAGRLVDLNSSMTGEYASADHAECIRENIEAGIPAALKTAKGIGILGRLTPDALMSLADQKIKAKGKLYKKKGIKYLEMTSAPVPASKTREKDAGGKKKAKKDDKKKHKKGD
jgi:hypothetical protein